MDHVRMETTPQLTRPALVCAFRGWNDGGEAATSAASYLKDRWEARPFASLDPEEFFDFQVTRPTVRLVEGVTRKIDWPRNDFFHASPGGSDVVVFLGIEPNVRWRTYTEAILGLARELEAESVITLGAFLADVPHTLPTPLAGTAPDPEEAAALGVTGSRYEGPTGIVGILHDAALRSNMHSLSLWAAVPHYLPGGPNPKAALALVEKAAQLVGAPIETDTLARAAGSWERQVTESIAENPELVAYVRRLEEV
ncbi:MAG TPA: PAC2 family protein, partial [Actinomycetota bacterium]|nr:PAC2 family protein [Actinomycetota bacterium]